MKIGIIGAGKLGTALARLFIGGGHTVCLANSREPASLSPLIEQLGSAATAATVTDAVSQADIVVLAIRWEQIEAAINRVPTWDNRIVVDATNNRFGPKAEDIYDLGDENSSEVVNRMLGSARLVKAFNHQPISALQELHANRTSVKGFYMSGDDAAAKERVAELIRDIGGEPIDAGNLHVGGALQNTGGPLAGQGKLLSTQEARTLLDRATERHGR
jgi:predicted dinucleotide-binding enzyme